MDEAAFAKLDALLQYIDGDYADPATFATLCARRSARAKHPTHYLAIPPSLFGSGHRAARQVRLRGRAPAS